MSQPDLTALIGSRICHDLISPIGAIGNGVELLNMGGLAVGPEMALISESVENANARIRFFRVAFGAANAGSAIGRGEAVSILQGVYRAGRTKVTWDVAGDQPRSLVKLAFLTLQCVESALVWGGEVRISEADGRWQFEATGEKVKFDETLWSVAEGAAISSDLAAADVHFALAPIAAAADGRRLSVMPSDQSLSVSF